MNMIFIIILCIVCIIIVASFLITFRLGKMQNPSQNEKYVKNRKNTFLLLSGIYLLTLIIAALLFISFL